MAKVMIFSLEHDAWWKPNSRGYTTDQAQAGLYDEAQVAQIVRGANIHGGRRNEVMVRQFDDGGVRVEPVA